MAFAEVLISVVAQEVLKKVISVTDDKLSRAWGLTGDLQKLRKKLMMIQAYLGDAEARQTRDESVKLWLANLREVAYNADHFLDEFAFEIFRRKMEAPANHRKRNKVHNFLSSSCCFVAFRFKMSRRVKSIGIGLDSVIKEASQFGLAPLRGLEGGLKGNGVFFRRTHPFVDDKEIVGRAEDVLKVVNMLVSPDNDKDLSILAIVGMAGLGKTTLAQLVYKNETVRRHFEKHVWVCVSDDFNVERLLQDLLESVSGAHPGLANVEPLVQKVKESLSGKSCLLVLDDVWTTDARKWESMKNALLGIGAAKQTRVLVTTRSSEVASTLQAPLVYYPKVLSDEESLFVFKQHAFASGGMEETRMLSSIAEEIVDKCKGLPLAIRAMGGLMHSKKTMEEWMLIRNSKTWDLPDDANGIFPALRLSYDNLPSSCLKQCFAYCSIFPKDFVFNKDDLIQIWMAQGFLNPPRGSHLSMEDKGNEYFHILLGNSFFQDAFVDVYGDAKEFKMHDLVHDLAQSVSRSEVLALYDGGACHNNLLHLSATSQGNVGPIIEKEYSKKLRTLFLDGEIGCDQLQDFNSLRVLKLQGVHIRDLPASISKMKQLRYLDISRTSIRALPEFVTKLYNLQTLRVTSCQSSLPEELTNLINLRHLYIDDSEVQLPRWMARLTSLQTLKCFDVGHEKGRGIEELGPLNGLRGSLCIQNLGNVQGREHAKKANLLAKTKLWKLKLVWGSVRSDHDEYDDEVLEALHPHSYLKSLRVNGFRGEKLPSWIPQLETLVKFKLFNCERCQDLPVLGFLPCLKVLFIGGMGKVRKIGSEFHYDHHPKVLFPALRSFTIEHMSGLVEWTEPSGADPQVGLVVFPFLEELSIIDCPELRTVPSHDFPFLKKLVVHEVASGSPVTKICSKLTTLTTLDIRNVLGLVALPSLVLLGNKNLSYVTIWSCPELECISEGTPLTWSRGYSGSLRCLYIRNCEKLSHLPDGLDTLLSLEVLKISYCRNVMFLPSLQGLTSLWRLQVTGSNVLTSLPFGIQSCTSLEDLVIADCKNLVVDLNVQSLNSLRSLRIHGCPRMTSLPKGLQCLTSGRLKFLALGGFSNELLNFPDLGPVLHVLANLEEFTVYGWPKLKSLPSQVRSLCGLVQFWSYDFSSVEALPDWLGDLSSLQVLGFQDCENLMELPAVETMQSLSKLKRLDVYGCPKLKESCAKNVGPQWSKISHIPNVYFF